MELTNAKYKNILAMLIFGSIGLFVKEINGSSSQIALLRGIIGSLFLLSVSFLLREKLSFKAIRQNLVLLILSGAAIGFNWILLFQSYKYTTVSNATLSYYFAPIFVMMLSPIVLKEKLSKINVLSIIAAMIGLFLIVNNGSSPSEGSYQHMKGILFGLSAAVLYASAVLMNKFIRNLPGFETTLVQLMLASLVLLPYVGLKDPLSLTGFNLKTVLLILLIGILHTGVAYFLYFTSIKDLEGQTIAVLSYIDPISAVLLAAIFLGEKMSGIQIFGGLLILGSTFLSEKLKNRRQ